MAFNALAKIKRRWNIESNTQILIVFIVFAVTGFSVLYVKSFLYSLIGVSPDWEWYIRFPIWLVTILPTYYVLLLFFGALFGQKDFFLWFIRKSFSRFLGKKKEVISPEAD